MKLHVHTTLSFHHKPQSYEKQLMSGIETIIFSCPKAAKCVIILFIIVGIL